MKKNIYKTIIFVFAFFTINLSVTSMLEHIQEIGIKKSPNSGTMRTIYNIEHVETPAIIIGSSRASHHYIPSIIKDSLGMDTYNCGRDGSFLLYQTCMIDAIIKRYSPKLIIWDISLVNTNKEKELQSFPSMYYYYGTNNFIDSIICLNNKSGKYTLELKTYRYNSLILNYLKAALTHEGNNLSGYSPLPNSGYIHPTLKENESNYITPVNKDDEIDRMRLIQQTLKKCKDKNIMVYAVLSPMYSKIDDSYKNTEIYQFFLKEIEENNFKLLDFYQRETYLKDSTLFKDASHMNDKGANVFTKELCKEINSLN